MRLPKPRAARVFPVILALFVLAIVMAGCSSATSSLPVPVSAPSSSPVATATAVATASAGPGLVDEGDTVVARGWLSETDLEGGTWVLAAQPPTSSVSTRTIAVLVAGTVPVSDFAKYRDAEGYHWGRVEIRGRRASGASTRMAGPEIMVDSITPY